MNDYEVVRLLCERLDRIEAKLDRLTADQDARREPKGRMLLWKDPDDYWTESDNPTRHEHDWSETDPKYPTLIRCRICHKTGTRQAYEEWRARMGLKALRDRDATYQPRNPMEADALREAEHYSPSSPQWNANRQERDKPLPDAPTPWRSPYEGIHPHSSVPKGDKEPQ